MTTPEGQQQPEDRVAEARQAYVSAVEHAHVMALGAQGDGSDDECLELCKELCGELEAAIRADERQRLAALCAWCGKERPTDGYANEALCFGPDGTSEPHTFETTASALARLERERAASAALLVELQREALAAEERCWCGHEEREHAAPRPGREQRDGSPEPWHCQGCCEGEPPDVAFSDYSARCFHAFETTASALGRLRETEAQMAALPHGGKE